MLFTFSLFNILGHNVKGSFLPALFTKISDKKICRLLWKFSFIVLLKINLLTAALQRETSLIARQILKELSFTQVERRGEGKEERKAMKEKN